MVRFCETVAQTSDGGMAICIDLLNKDSILSYVYQSKQHFEHWRQILHLLLGGHRNSVLYTKANDSEGRIVSLMQFLKGKERGRIYCKEQAKDGASLIIAVGVYKTSKVDITGKQELNLITKISNYDYEIKKYKN